MTSQNKSIFEEFFPELKGNLDGLQELNMIVNDAYDAAYAYKKITTLVDTLNSGNPTQLDSGINYDPTKDTEKEQLLNFDDSSEAKLVVQDRNVLIRKRTSKLKINNFLERVFEFILFYYQDFPEKVENRIRKAESRHWEKSQKKINRGQNLKTIKLCELISFIMYDLDTNISSTKWNDFKVIEFDHTFEVIEYLYSDILKLGNFMKMATVKTHLKEYKKLQVPNPNEIAIFDVEIVRDNTDLSIPIWDRPIIKKILTKKKQ